MDDIQINEKVSVLEAIIDWVSVTFKYVTVEKIIKNVLKLDKSLFIKLNNGKNGYGKQYVFGNISIQYGDERYDIHLMLNGAGCRQLDFYLKFQEREWKDFFQECLDLAGSFTRVDLALDDRKTYFTIKELDKKIDNGELVSRFRKSNTEHSKNVSDGSNRGMTLYIGSKKSDIFVRMYEKNYEQADKLKVFVEEIGPWNRYEIEMRDDYANECAMNLSEISDISWVVKSIFVNYVRFVVKDEKNSNRSRWKIWSKWHEFIKDAGKLKLYVKPEAKTFEDTINWLEKQVSTSLSTIKIVEECLNLDGLFIEKILSKAKLKKVHVEKIKTYLNGMAEMEKGVFTDDFLKKPDRTEEIEAILKNYGYSGNIY